jgi:hypothetical protein
MNDDVLHTPPKTHPKTNAVVAQDVDNVSQLPHTSKHISRLHSRPVLYDNVYAHKSQPMVSDRIQLASGSNVGQRGPRPSGAILNEDVLHTAPKTHPKTNATVAQDNGNVSQLPHASKHNSKLHSRPVLYDNVYAHKSQPMVSDQIQLASGSNVGQRGPRPSGAIPGYVRQQPRTRPVITDEVRTRLRNSAREHYARSLELQKMSAASRNE